MSTNDSNNSSNDGIISVISTNRQSNECDTSLPSIFDYLAQDSLRTQLKPGILAAIKLFSDRFPRAELFHFLNKHFDLIFILFQTLLEAHYLQRFFGSFSENFYGMKRVPADSNNNNNTFLSLSHKIRSLITLVILPNIAEKITKLYENLKNNPFGTKNNFGWRYFLLLVFPHLRAFNYLAIIFFQIGYTFSLIKIPSWIFLLSGTRLEIFNSNDFSKIELSNGRNNTKNFLARCWRLFFWLPSTIGRILSFSLFLIQFLEIYYKDELGLQFSKIINREDNKINFNEFPINKLPFDYQTLCRTGKCPICRQLRYDEAVLSISGYIFCYSCIYKFILINGCCPITSLPATKNEIIKIYR